MIGHSVRGRPIHAYRVGPPARRKLLVFGLIHGDESAGVPVARRLRRVRPPRGVEILLVGDLNPDGHAASTRQNARGVDLNRNFPRRWRLMGRPFETHFSGPRPASEPETRVAMELIERVKPRVTVWYHQALRLVTKKTGGDPALERIYARAVRFPHRRLPPYPGTATSWQNRLIPGSTAFVVELPRGRLSRRGGRTHARAVLKLARTIAPPRLHQRRIPFSRKRKDDMRRYARRHYGIDDHRLARPRVVVQHYTTTNSLSSVFNTFRPNVPDQEFGELPGTCAHFVIDRDGAIYQLVALNLMCRHTVGLNYTAIGIEHVGRSDGAVLSNRRQIRASFKLTRYLQGRFGIKTRNVIGHNENRSSPFHRERVPRFRNQTHGDFRRRSMNRYRRGLRRMPRPSSVR